MEELTIEQKAKRYDEAIKIAKSKIKNDKDHVLYEEDIIEIFHELKKKTDEEIIQKLIAVCHRYYGEGIDTEIDECLEWLEKQKGNPYSGTSFVYNNHTWGMCARDGGVDILCDSKLIKHIGEQKPTERKDFILASFGTDIKLENDTIIIPEGCVATIDGNKIHIKREGKSALEAINEEKVDNANKVEPKFKVGDIVQYITDSTDRRKIEEVDTLCNMYHTDSSPIMFEIEDEWKVVVNAEDVEFNPTDKIEPKFKVGDWIVKKDGKNFCNGSKFVQITNIDGTMCYFDCGSWLCEDKIRLWTLTDAKDGDVLVDCNKDEVILMFRGIGNTEWNDVIDYHCYYSCFRKAFCVQKGVDYWGNTNDHKLKPTTKEQRELLYQKIKEAGYEWDSEGKELKKI